MKYFFYSLLTAILFTNASKAATGDTTWVQAHSDVQLDHYGAFDVQAQFPDGSKSYRKIFMTVTLGKYQCPNNPQYCGDWDYTVQNFLMTPNGDTLELGRLITPYANASYTRTPWSWRERYTFDVTDFYLLLKNDATIRLFYSGYSWGFTGDIKFAFIEGMPARNVVGIERLWHGSFAYGNDNDPISDKLTTVNKTAPSGTNSAEMKFNISGHGADDQGCSEFCKRYYQVKVDGNTVEQKDIWRDNCGKNHLYPQSGTWVYNRGNWCPGDLIHTNVHKLPNITAGTTFDLGVEMEPYSNANPSASYIIEGGLWYYGDFNHSVDATLEDIVAPTIHEAHFRENPSTKPTIVVRNTGRNAITSMNIEYGIDGQAKQLKGWQGNIAPMEEQEITLDALYPMQTVTDTGKFVAKILQVNGQQDEDNSNNELASTFAPVPQWGSKIAVSMRTNSVADNKWKLYLYDNTLVAQRDGTEGNKVYNDTVQLWPGMYRLEVTDSSCDGMNYWVNKNDVGVGSIQVRPATGGASYKLAGYFSGDFGCGFTQYFNVNWPQAVTEVKADEVSMQAYPNPANNVLHVAFEGVNKVDGTVYIIDAIGRVVIKQLCGSANELIDISGLSNGMYTVSYSDERGTSLKTRIIVAK